MGDNKCTGQIIGPFLENQDLIELIRIQSDINFAYVKHIGIQTYTLNPVSFLINNKEYEMSKTGTYEIGNTKIEQLSFLQNVDNNTIIDYTIQLEDA